MHRVKPWAFWQMGRCSTAGEKLPSLKSHISSVTSGFKPIPLPVQNLVWTGFGGCLLLVMERDQKLFPGCSRSFPQIICEDDRWGAMREENKVLCRCSVSRKPGKQSSVSVQWRWYFLLCHDLHLLNHQPSGSSGEHKALIIILL